MAQQRQELHRDYSQALLSLTIAEEGACQPQAQALGCGPSGISSGNGPKARMGDAAGKTVTPARHN